MYHNNRKWYTVFIKPRYTDQDWKILGHIRGEGNCDLMVMVLQNHYDNRLRTLEGKVTKITDELKARYI